MKKAMLVLLIISISVSAQKNIRIGDKYFKKNDQENAFQYYITAYNNNEKNALSKIEQFTDTEERALKYLIYCEEFDNKFSNVFVSLIVPRHFISLQKYDAEIQKRILLSNFRDLIRSSDFSQDLIEKAFESGYSDYTVRSILVSNCDDQFKKQIFNEKYPEPLIIKFLSSKAFDKLSSSSAEYADKILTVQRSEDAVISIFSSNLSENTIMKLLYSKYSDPGIEKILNAGLSDDMIEKILSKNYEEDQMLSVIENPLSKEILASSYSEKSMDNLMSAFNSGRRSEKFVRQILYSEYSEALTDSLLFSKYSEDFLIKILSLNPSEEKFAVLFGYSIPEDLISEYIFNFPFELIQFTIQMPFQELNKSVDFKSIDGQTVPRGEFETTKQYQERLKAAEKNKTELQAKYKKIHGDLKNQLTYALNYGIGEKYITQNKLKVDSIGTYDPDLELYPITINSKTEKVKMPVQEAAVFKANYNKAEVVSLIKLNADFKGFSHYNTTVIHPVSFKKYPFGKQEITDITANAVKNPVVPPNLIIQGPLWTDPNGNNFLDASEERIIAVAVSNNGQGEADNVVVQVKLKEAVKGISISHQILFPKIKPNETQIAEFKVRADNEINSGKIEFIIQAKELNNYNPESRSVTIETLAGVKPEKSGLDIDSSKEKEILESKAVMDNNRLEETKKSEAEPAVTKQPVAPVASVKEPAVKTKEEKFKEEIKEENIYQKPDLDINKKTGKVEVGYYKTLESDATRRCWLEEGGRLMTKGFTVNYVYTSMDMDEMDSDFSMHGFGYTGSMYYKWLNPPSYDLGKSMWTSPGIGFSGSTNVTFGSMSMSSSSYDMDMDLIMLSIELSVPCGYTFGLGKFLSRSDWKGVMVGVFWKPSYNITSTTTTIDMDPDPYGMYPMTGDPVADGALNLTGIQWTIDYGSFSDLAEDLAQEAHLSINGFILPETDNTPFMFSIGLGMIWY